jgi:hypothetical protein
VLRWFGSVFERYNKPQGFNGRFLASDEDYFKFLGHELFVSFVAALLREERWNLIEDILRRPISMKYVPDEYGPGIVDWRYASEPVVSIIDESPRRQRISFHADILKERHTTGGLAEGMPMETLMAADYFLYLFGEMSQEAWNRGFFAWNPWSALFLKRAPVFLRHAEHRQVAETLVRVFRLPSVEEFRNRLRERAPHLRQLYGRGFWDDPFKEEYAARFGTV